MVSLTVQAANVPPEIRNLKVQQRPGTYLVDVTFDLVDPDSLNGVFLSLEASSDNGVNFNLPAKTLSGDTGLIKPGTGKKIVWDAFTDWPDKYTPNAKVRIVANDSLPQGPTQGPDGFVWIPPGKFMMGSPADEPDRGNDELQHEVLIGAGYWMSDHEVTQAEYLSIIGTNPSFSTGNLSKPVDAVTYEQAVYYCKKLTDRERQGGRITIKQVFRLPTEAEWEYAARANTTGPRYGDLHLIAWWLGNMENESHPVKLKLPNAWGLYDMIGNICEWCADWYGEYTANPSANPRGPNYGTYRVGRGGGYGWHSDVKYCRSAVREFVYPGDGGRGLGFRTILSSEQ